MPGPPNSAASWAPSAKPVRLVHNANQQERRCRCFQLPGLTKEAVFWPKRLGHENPFSLVRGNQPFLRAVLPSFARGWPVQAFLGLMTHLALNLNAERRSRRFCIFQQAFCKVGVHCTAHGSV